MAHLPSDRGSQRTVPLAEAVATGMTCLGDLRDRSSNVFTPRQAREAIDDLARNLPTLSPGLVTQYGLSVTPEALGALARLREALDDWNDGDVPDGVDALARSAMSALLGGKLPY